MTAVTEQQVADFAEPIIKRIVSELGAVPSDEFEHVAEIKNLGGDVTGFARVWTADRIYKITHLSINIMPGARYFNILVVPDAKFDAPRFAHEGMISVHGSQVSTDLYHDVDTAVNILEIISRTQAVNEIFLEAKESGIDFVPSRQAHMRAFCSPHFLNVFGPTSEQFPQLADYADRYFSEWKKLFAAAAELDSAAADDRQRRRTHMSDMVIKLDPDRQMVVQVYGEKTVSDIEKTVMY